MNKYEFITNLQRHLTGKVTPEKLQELTQYYNDYIDSEVRKGKSEEEVLKMLGDPRLLAKSIVETEGECSYRENVYEEQGQEQKKLHLNVKAFLTLLAVILILIVVLSVVFNVIGLVLSIFVRYVLPVAIPVLLVYFIIQIFRQ
ncbi:MAG: DUF1700 domain-containing protein [Lachnospiraceae bacterium]